MSYIYIYIYHYIYILWYINVYYIKKTLDNYNNSELNILIDIDCLSLDRNSFSYIPIKNLYNTEPLPLQKILNNIINKTYCVLFPSESLTKLNYTYLIWKKKIVMNGLRSLENLERRL